jgi:hypothetical protein
VEDDFIACDLKSKGEGGIKGYISLLNIPKGRCAVVGNDE